MLHPNLADDWMAQDSNVKTIHSPKPPPVRTLKTMGSSIDLNIALYIFVCIYVCVCVCICVYICVYIYVSVYPGVPMLSREQLADNKLEKLLQEAALGVMLNG